MKTKPEKKLNRYAALDQLRVLTNALQAVDHQSQTFLVMDELTAANRVDLNVAASKLKKEIIFSQTRLWNALTADDSAAASREFNAEIEALHARHLAPDIFLVDGKKTKRKKRA
jgi:hypothetical protein